MTADSRILVGELAACDASTNLVCNCPLSPLESSSRKLLVRLSKTKRQNADHFVLYKVLKNALERIIRTPDDPEPSAEVPLGLYLVRGDNVCSVGLVDETLDDSIDWTQVKGAVIGGIKHI